MSSFSLNNAESFLVVPAMILMDTVYELFQVRIIRGQLLCVGQLGIVTLTTTVADARIVIRWTKERRATTEIAVKLSKEDAYAGKVKVAEVDVFVLYTGKPFDEVVTLVLWITRDKKDRPAGIHSVEQPLLLSYAAEILTVLNAHHENIFRDAEILVVINKSIAALWRTYLERAVVKHSLYRLITVDEKALHCPASDKLAVTGKLYLLRAACLILLQHSERALQVCETIVACKIIAELLCVGTLIASSAAMRNDRQYAVGTHLVDSSERFQTA